MHAVYSILQASDDRAGRIVLSSKVINAFEPDHRCQTRETEYIAVQSIHCGGTDLQWINDGVTANPFVHDRDLVTIRLVQPDREIITPTVVAVNGGKSAVGD